MKTFSLLTLLFCSAIVFAQDISGYYVNNDGKKTEGYFKSTDFYDASSLMFRNSLLGSYTNLKPEEIKEYAIGNNSFKFKKYTVQYDTSGIYDDKLSKIKDPEWKTGTVFLSVIAEGDAVLYLYNNNAAVHFFYTVKGVNETPIQLVNKKYRDGTGEIAQNTYYKQQLFTDVNCNEKPVSLFYGIKHSQSALTEYIKDYNTCKGSETVLYQEAYKGKAKVSLTVFAGINNTVFGVKNANPEIDNTTAINFSAGVEAAVGLYSGKWQGFLKVEYEKLKVNADGVVNRAYNALTDVYELDINVISLQFGPRYNFTVNDNSRIFIDGALALNLPFEKDILRKSYIITPTGLEYDANDTVFEISTAISSNFGVGYVFADKYSVDLRYRTNRNLFNGTNTGSTTHLSGLNLNFRYTIN